MAAVSSLSMQSSASAAVQSRSGESSGRSIHRPDRRTFKPAQAKRPGREGEERDAAGEPGSDASMEPASRREQLAGRPGDVVVATDAAMESLPGRRSNARAMASKNFTRDGNPVPTNARSYSGSAPGAAG